MDNTRFTKITYQNYVGHGYKKQLVDTLDGPIYIYASEEKFDSSNIKDIVIYDLEDRTHDNCIYLDLANANTDEQIIDFCNTYGSIVNPFMAKTGFSTMHDLGPLQSLCQDIKKNTGKEMDIVIQDLFRYYQIQAKCLVEIYCLLSDNLNKADNLYLLLQYCIKFFSNYYFIAMLNLEHNIVSDDTQEYFSYLSRYPSIAFIYSFHQEILNKNNENTFCEELMTVIAQKNDHSFLSNIAKLYLKEPNNLKSREFKSFLIENKTSFLTYANSILTDALSFEIREVREIALDHLDIMLNWQFSSLANAIFYSFYLDKISKIIIKPELFMVA